ncbi:chloride channel protein [Lysinimonas soli]|uniref:Chloride channel protein n=1 Tax=Lysinimonas soli TaxID=1074233 RepID=A0ABW0NU46_9MICO
MPVESRDRPSWILRLIVVTILVGVGSGIGGLLVSLVLHAVEHLAYGYSSGTFLDGVLASSPQRRLIALCVAGVLGALGWWALRRWGRPVVSVERGVDGARMPALTTALNATLQIVVVGLGASVGREVAPRELGALVGGWLSDRAGLTARERRILVACGAGAGLAAVYNVPLGGAVFAIEILLAELSLATVLPALATAAIATLVARIGVPADPLYVVPQLSVTPSLLVWAVVAGPVLGFAALGFVKVVDFAGDHRPRGWRILAIMPIAFAIVGALSIVFPEILGNGRALGQVAFSGTLALGMLAVTALVKAFATAGTIGSGAAGGTLTPALAIGASLGIVLGGCWSLLWPGTPAAAFAFVAGAAFLASSLRAPFTAVILVVEFTGQGPVILLPTIVAVAGAIAVTHYFGRRALVGID